MKNNKKILKLVLTITFLSIIIGVISLYFSTGSYGKEMFTSYFKISSIAVLNILPIILLVTILYLLTNRLWAGFFITSIIVLVPTLINFYKIKIRNDPLVVKDVALLGESFNMTGKFSIQINYQIILSVIFILALTIITAKFFNIKAKGKYRIAFLLVFMLVTGTVFNYVYLNKDLYNSIENFSLINKWSQTQTYISKGFIYPFMHSFNYAFDQKPDNYSDNLAKQILNKYSNDDIPKSKKVNVIGIMLEAYNDFSKFENVDFLIDVYAPLRRLQAESYHGELVTNIFAGGTVDTEWSFLTGYTNYNDFRAKTNSYVHYFKNQGYYVEGSHPCYKWFYNRENVNKHLGFENYYFFENHYGDLAKNEIAGDKILFKEITKFYEQALENDKPYFSFNVSYQNHGPYASEYTNKKSFISNNSLSTESYNILNNYIAGISYTNQLLERFIDSYRDKESTVIILFGDHNPWLGDDNKVYHELGINIDLETEEGFYNYYNTPYLIWANDNAKKTLGNSFTGKGDTIGPYFLMNKFFNLAGYKGNSFMKLSNELLTKTKVVHGDSVFLVNNSMVRDLNDDKNFLNDFLIAQYYYRNNYLE